MKKQVDKNNIKSRKILIGKVLKETRKSLGLTQEEVSETLFLAPRYISDIERDKTKGSLDTLVKLCNLYKVSPTYILKEYLEIPNIDSPNSITGFQALTDEEKQIVKQLVHFMNRSKKAKKTDI